ncbi:hypothetical protein C0992_008512 [Termitomyces sp. T32_za158]|nr:hypothetical protein C0992_008512 [Termitomyces sp. T32_za158]
MQWLDAYAFNAEERLDNDPALATRVYTQLASRLIQNGMGSVLLFGTIREETNLILAEAMQHAGLRAYVGKLSMDIDIALRPTYTESSASAALSAASSFPVLTLRFVPTCSDELLAGLGALAAADTHGLRIQSHLAESSDSISWVSHTLHTTELDIFEHSALLTPRTTLAHCTFLSAGSLAALATHGTGIAHCPLSNAYFSARTFPLRQALAADVKVGLGTDIAGGYSLDVMSVMRWAVGVARMREGQLKLEDAKESTGGQVDDMREATADVDTPPGDSAEVPVLDWKGALYLATRSGASTLGLHPKSGTFDIGAPFNAQLSKCPSLSLSSLGTHLHLFIIHSPTL